MDQVAAGKRLRKAREARGCTVRKFSEMIGLTYQYCHQLERGERAMSAPKLRMAARLLGVSADWLLGLSKAGGPKKG